MGNQDTPTDIFPHTASLLLFLWEMKEPPLLMRRKKSWEGLKGLKKRGRRSRRPFIFAGSQPQPSYRRTLLTLTVYSVQEKEFSPSSSYSSGASVCRHFVIQICACEHHKHSSGEEKELSALVVVGGGGGGRGKGFFSP